MTTVYLLCNNNL